MNVAIELPKHIANSLAGPDEDLSRIALEALAAQGYRDGKLSHSEVQRPVWLSKIMTKVPKINSSSLLFLLSRLRKL